MMWLHPHQVHFPDKSGCIHCSFLPLPSSLACHVLRLNFGLSSLPCLWESSFCNAVSIVPDSGGERKVRTCPAGSLHSSLISPLCDVLWSSSWGHGGAGPRWLGVWVVTLDFFCSSLNTDQHCVPSAGLIQGSQLTLLSLTVFSWWYLLHQRLL